MRVVAVLLGLMLVEVTPASAHKVIASVFMAGDMIEGEIGFSNGAVAANQIVQVLDTSGNPLGQTVTDEDGFFVFEPVGDMTHVFRADLGAGHVAEAVMEGSELSDDGEAPVAPTAGRTGSVVTTTLPPEMKDEIAKMIRDELRPLRQEIAAYREKNDFQNILGGIGYIFGLFGVGFYVMARRQGRQEEKT
ncbi:cobalt ABC transporter permease [Amaricoccus tamworthensis]|uniref:cobalt ABC transporter permease n=1 Tax=Amaricoccus tamworthensis TaxID=57002 RepID=UPI003C7BEA3A